MLIAGIVFLLAVQFSFAAICFHCQGIADPTTCSNVVTCAATENCYIEQVVTSAGKVVYNTGCESQQLCSSLSGPLVGRRMISEFEQQGTHRTQRKSTNTDLMKCEDCCEHDFCNNEGCGVTAVSRAQRGPYCYTCDTAHDPSKCSTVSLCEANEMCFIYLPTTSSGSQGTLYKSQCLNKTLCAAISQTATNPQCTAYCCDDDFCNDACYTNLETTTYVVATATSAKTPLSPRPTTTTLLTTEVTVAPTTQSTTVPSTELTITSGCKSDHYHDDITGMCIKIIENQQLSYQNAKHACEALGDRLVTIDSHEKTTFVEVTLMHHSSVQLPKDRNYWTGAYDLHNKTEYYWLNGEKMVYTNWGGGDEVAPNQQPDDHKSKNQDCVLLYGADGYRWADDLCWNARYFICENPSTLLHSGSTNTENSCKEGHFYDQYTGLCIKIMESQQVSYSSAKRNCEHFGDRLVTIDSHEKTIFIDNTLIHQSTLLEEKDRTFWIGAYDGHHKDVFQWPDGHLLSYTNWGGGNEVAHNQQPDGGSQDCVMLYGADHYRWHDDTCGHNHYYICEYTKNAPNGHTSTNPAPVATPSKPTGSHGPLCFTCESMARPDDCTHSTWCDADEVCFVQKSTTLSVSAGHAVYTSKCEPTVACSVIASLHHDADCNPLCCNTDLCNNKCSEPQHTPPPTHPPPPTTTQTHSDSCPTSQGWQRLHDHATSICIKVHTNHANWNAARSACKHEHGDLVVMDTTQKVALVRNFVLHNGKYNTEGAYWFGAYDMNKRNLFVWINKHTHVDLRHGEWDSGQPNHHDGGHDQDCAVMWRDSNEKYLWHDDYCSRAFGFICEKV